MLWSKKTSPRGCLSWPLLERMAVVKLGEIESIRYGKMEVCTKKEKE